MTLWIKESQIFMIFLCLFWKWRQSPFQYWALNSHKKYFWWCSFHACLQSCKPSLYLVCWRPNIFCTIHTAHLVQYTLYALYNTRGTPCTIYTAQLVQYTLHTLSTLSTTKSCWKADWTGLLTKYSECDWKGWCFIGKT